MSKINTKTIARIAALQALYQYQINHNSQNAEELIDNISHYYKDKEINEDLGIPSYSGVKINKGLFNDLVNLTISNIDSIDKTIIGSLNENWKWESLHITLVALLRVAICELLYLKKTPTKVVINEFTNIASDMLKEGEIAFVNSVLDKLGSLELIAKT